MDYQKLQRWMGLGLGALALSGMTMAVTCKAMAEGERPLQAPDEAQAERPQPPGEGGGFGGGPGGPGGFGGPGGPGGRGGFGGGPGGPGGPPPFMMGGGASMTANATTVYVLRGNTIIALDAKTLRQTAKAELPPMEFGPGGPGGPGGGRPGRPGFGGGPGRPGAPRNGGNQ